MSKAVFEVEIFVVVEILWKTSITYADAIRSGRFARPWDFHLAEQSWSRDLDKEWGVCHIKSGTRCFQP